MSPRKPKCAWCGTRVGQAWGAINRAKSIGAPIYCNRECAGLGRRKNLSDTEKKAAKRLYDLEYRAKNLAMLKAKKRAYYERTYDPTEAAKYRAGRMSWHVEYCRRPEQVEKRKKRDRNRYAAEFGDFAESHRLLMDLIGEINARVSRNQIYQTNGTLNKRLTRQRAYERTLGRDTQRGPLGDLTRYQKRHDAARAG